MKDIKKRKLGRTGLEVSEIAFGGVEIGMPYGIGVESEKDMLSEEEAVRLLHAAVDEGITLFDTARMYGRSENIMGKAFKGMRDQVVISTKCVHLHHEEDKLPVKEKLRMIIENSLHESLRALQTDHVDIFMLHNATMEILEDDDVADIFSGIKRSGKARSVGVSTYLPNETKYALETGVWDVIQLPFNLLDQRQKEYFELAAQKGVGIIARSILFKGLLSDRGTNLHPKLRSVQKHIETYHTLLNNHFADLPTLATKFALSFKEISAVLVGIDRMEYLYKSVKTANGYYLGKETLLQAEQLSYPDPAFLNLPHWDEMGWLK